MPRFGAILISSSAILAIVLPNTVAETPPNSARMDRLLNEWEIKSARLKTLEFSVYRIDRDGTSNERHYEGIVAYKGATFAYRDLSKVKLISNADKTVVPELDTNKRRLTTPLETVVWTGEELWQYKYDSKKVSIYRLDKDLGPRRPEEAPLPFTFNVRAGECRRRYEMALLNENPKEYLVKITPRRGEHRNFSKAWIVLEARSLLPSRIVLLKSDETTTEDISLSHFQINQPVNDSYFRVALPGKPWKVERFPARRAPANAKATVPKRPAEEQAARPATSDADPH